MTSLHSSWKKNYWAKKNMSYSENTVQNPRYPKNSSTYIFSTSKKRNCMCQVHWQIDCVVLKYLACVFPQHVTFYGYILISKCYEFMWVFRFFIKSKLVVVNCRDTIVYLYYILIGFILWCLCDYRVTSRTFITQLLPSKYLLPSHLYSELNFHKITIYNHTFLIKPSKHSFNS